MYLSNIVILLFLNKIFSNIIVENTETFLYASRFQITSGSIRDNYNLVDANTGERYTCRIGDSFTLNCRGNDVIVIDLEPGKAYNINAIDTFDRSVLFNVQLKTVSKPIVSLVFDGRELSYVASYHPSGSLSTRCYSCVYVDSYDECQDRSYSQDTCLHGIITTNYGREYIFVLKDALDEELYSYKFKTPLIGHLKNVEIFLESSSYKIDYTVTESFNQCQIKSPDNARFKCLYNNVPSYNCDCSQGSIIELRRNEIYNVEVWNGLDLVATGSIETIPSVNTITIIDEIGRKLEYRVVYSRTNNAEMRCYICTIMRKYETACRHKIESDCVSGLTEDLRYGQEYEVLLLDYLDGVIASSYFVLSEAGRIRNEETFLYSSKYIVNYRYGVIVTGSCNIYLPNRTMLKCFNQGNVGENCNCEEDIVVNLNSGERYGIYIEQGLDIFATGVIYTVDKPITTISLENNILNYENNFGVNGALSTICSYCFTASSVTTDCSTELTQADCTSGQIRDLVYGNNYNILFLDGKANILSRESFFVEIPGILYNSENYLLQSEFTIIYSGIEITGVCSVYINNLQYPCYRDNGLTNDCDCYKDTVGGLRENTDYVIELRNKGNIMARGVLKTTSKPTLSLNPVNNRLIYLAIYGARGSLNTSCYYCIYRVGTTQDCSTQKFETGCNTGGVNNLEYQVEYNFVLLDGLNNILQNGTFETSLSGDLINKETFLFESRYEITYPPDFEGENKVCSIKDENQNILTCINSNNNDANCNCVMGVIKNLNKGNNYNIKVMYNGATVAEGLVQTISSAEITHEIKNRNLELLFDFGTRGPLSTSCYSCFTASKSKSDCLTNLTLVNCYFKRYEGLDYGREYLIMLTDGLHNEVGSSEISIPVPGVIKNREQFLHQSRYLIIYNEIVEHDIYCLIYDDNDNILECIDIKTNKTTRCSCSHGVLTNLNSNAEYRVTAIWENNILANGVIDTASRGKINVSIDLNSITYQTTFEKQPKNLTCLMCIYATAYTECQGDAVFVDCSNGKVNDLNFGTEYAIELIDTFKNVLAYETFSIPTPGRISNSEIFLHASSYQVKYMDGLTVHGMCQIYGTNHERMQCIDKDETSYECDCFNGTVAGLKENSVYYLKMENNNNVVASFRIRGAEPDENEDSHVIASGKVKTASTCHIDIETNGSLILYKAEFQRQPIMTKCYYCINTNIENDMNCEKEAIQTDCNQGTVRNLHFGNNYTFILSDKLGSPLGRQQFTINEPGEIENVETFLRQTKYRVIYPPGTEPSGSCTIIYNLGELNCIDNTPCSCIEDTIIDLNPGLDYIIMIKQGEDTYGGGLVQTVARPVLAINVDENTLAYTATYRLRGPLKTKCYYCISYDKADCSYNKIPTDCENGIVRNLTAGVIGTFRLLDYYNLLGELEFFVLAKGNLTTVETFLHESRYIVDYRYTTQITGSCNFRDNNGTRYKCINNGKQASEYDCDCFKGIVGYLPKDTVINVTAFQEGIEYAKGSLLTIREPDLLIRVVMDQIYYNADYGVKGPILTQCFYCVSSVSKTECDNKNRRTSGQCENGWFDILPGGISYNFYLYDGLDNQLGTVQFYLPPTTQVINEETFLYHSKYVINYESGQEQAGDECSVYVNGTLMTCVNRNRQPVSCGCSMGIVSGLEMGTDNTILVSNSSDVVLANGTIKTIHTAIIITHVKKNVANIKFDFGSRSSLNTKCYYSLCDNNAQEECSENKIQTSCDGVRLAPLIYGKEYKFILYDGLGSELGHDVFSTDIPGELENTETFLYESSYKAIYTNRVFISSKCGFYQDDIALQCNDENMEPTTQCDCFSGMLINLKSGSDYNILVRYDDHIIAKGVLKTVSIPLVNFDIQMQRLTFVANYGERGPLETRCSACLYKNDMAAECLSSPFTNINMNCEIGSNSEFKYGNAYNFSLFDGLKNVLYSSEVANFIPWSMNTTETFITGSLYVVQNMDQFFISLNCQVYEVKSMQRMSCLNSNNITTLDCNCYSSLVANLPSGLNLEYYLIYNESILANGILYTVTENPEFNIVRRFPNGLEYNFIYRNETLTPSRACTLVVVSGGSHQLYVGNEFCTNGVILNLESNMDYNLYAFDYMNATIGIYEFSSMNYTYEVSNLGVVKVHYRLNGQTGDRQCFFRDDDGFVYSCMFNVCNCQEDVIINLDPARTYKLNIFNQDDRFAGIILFSTPSKAEISLSPTDIGAIKYDLTFTTVELPTKCRFCYKIGQDSLFHCSVQDAEYCKSGIIDDIQYMKEYTIQIQDGFTDLVSEIVYYMELSQITAETIGLRSIRYKNFGYFPQSADVCNFYDDSNTKIKCLSPYESCSCFEGTFIGLQQNLRYNLSMFLPSNILIGRGLVATGCSPVVTADVDKETINITSKYSCSFNPVSTCNYYFFLEPIDFYEDANNAHNYNISNADDIYLNQDCNKFYFREFHYGRRYHLIITDFNYDYAGTVDFETLNTVLLQTTYLLRDIDYKVGVEDTTKLRDKICNVYDIKNKKFLTCVVNGRKTNDCSCLNGRITDLKDGKVYNIGLILGSSVLADGELYTSNNGTVNLNSLGLRSFNYSTEFKKLVVETSVCNIQLIRHRDGRERVLYDYMYDSKNPSASDTNTCSKGRIDHLDANYDYRFRINDKYGSIIYLRSIFMPREPASVSANIVNNVVRYKIVYQDKHTPVNCTFFTSREATVALECSYYFYCDCSNGMVIIDSQPSTTLFVYDYEKNYITSISIEEGKIISAASVAAISVVVIIVAAVIILIISFVLIKRSRSISNSRSHKASNYINGN